MTVFYWATDNQTGMVTSSDRVPKGAQVVTQQDHDARIRAYEEERRARSIVARTERQAIADADYAALLTAGIPAETAHRLTGGKPFK